MGRPTLHDGCSVSGCDGAHTARGYCARHYAAANHRGEFATRPKAHNGSSMWQRLSVHTTRVGDHLVWTGSRRGHSGNIPQVGGHTANFRVALWVEMNGREVPDGYTVIAGRWCPELCVEPSHSIVASVADAQRLSEWRRPDRSQFLYDLLKQWFACGCNDSETARRTGIARSYVHDLVRAKR